jgi:hypothetical protein
MTPEEQAGLPSNDWLSAKWRPAMGWMYMIVCIFDFIIFPILWTAIQAYDRQGVISTEWEPLTLKGAGLFHMAMGAVLGVAAWSRGQEKITAMNQASNGFNNYSNNRYYPPMTSNNNTYRQVPQPPAPEL